MMLVALVLVALGHLALASQATPADPNTQPRTLNAVFDLIFNVGRDYYLQGDQGYSDAQSRYDCPQCDSSVYSYCSEKLLHDACCCLNPYEHHLPRQCRYADCSFLHANSCREHKLITACCCSRKNFF